MTSWVLVVAADERRQRLVRTELEEVGFEVEEVSTVDAALSWLGVMRPSMIVVDQRLAGVDRLKAAAGRRPGRDGRKIPLLNLGEALA